MIGQDMWGSAWEDAKVVEDYASDEWIGLQKPEQVIFDEIKGVLPEWKMLDLGVGGGRTTYHFAPLVKEYVGVDISSNMIRKCREKYKQTPKIQFKVGNATKLDCFGNSCFDFVLFSFNGIDYVNHEQRLLILGEVSRVLKSGGLFWFSTHNLNVLNSLYDVKENGLLFVIRMIVNNLFADKTENYQVINDGAHDFRLKTYYANLLFQYELLKDYFDEIRFFDFDGEELNQKCLESCNSIRINFLCKKK